MVRHQQEVFVWVSSVEKDFDQLNRLWKSLSKDPLWHMNDSAKELMGAQRANTNQKLTLKATLGLYKIMWWFRVGKDLIWVRETFMLDIGKFKSKK